jgi:hypothetical protein
MPRPCHALTMPFFSRPRHSTAVERRPVSYLPAFGFFRLPRGVLRRCYQKHTKPLHNDPYLRLQRVVAAHYKKKDDLLNCRTSSSDISGYHAHFYVGHGTVGAEQGNGMACWINARHGHGMLCVNPPLEYPSSRQCWCCNLARNRWTKHCYRKKPHVTCRHVGEVSCVYLTAIFVCFRKIKVINVEQNFFKYGVIVTFVACRYTALEWAWY